MGFWYGNGIFSIYLIDLLYVEIFINILFYSKLYFMQFVLFY